MDTDRNLLFGVLAFQKGAIDADRLAETCSTIAGEATVSVPDRLVDRGWLTVDQKVELERTLDAELTAHSGEALQGIDRPGVDRPGIGHDAERLVSRGEIVRDLADEIVHPDFETLVHRDVTDVFLANS